MMVPVWSTGEMQHSHFLRALILPVIIFDLVPEPLPRDRAKNSSVNSILGIKDTGTLIYNN